MAWSIGERKDEAKRTTRNKIVEMRPLVEEPSDAVAGEGKSRDELAKERDLAGGMEMLEMDFLLGVIEKTKSNDKNDVTMRKLGFNELVRRKELKAADSKSLKAYAINQGSLYDKRIQCEALKELAERTRLRSG